MGSFQSAAAVFESGDDRTATCRGLTPDRRLRRIVSGMESIPLSKRALRTSEPPITWLMATALDRPGLISLAAGFTSAGALPVEELGETVREVLGGDRDRACAALQYGTTAGREPLRRWILDRLGRLDGIDPAAHGMRCDDVVLGNGSQQILYLVADVLLDPGDLVLVGDPTYFVFVAILDALGASTVGAEVGRQGVEPGSLREAFAALEARGELHRLKLVYLVPYYQNPTGATVPWDAKQEIYEILAWYRRKSPFFVIEDAAYRDLRFDGDDVPSLKSLDTGGDFVVYAATFTKPLATGLKCGYGILPRALVPHVVRQKSNHDFGSAHFNQAVVETFVASGRYESHLARIAAHYRAKMTIMDIAMREFFPPGWSWATPQGGLYIWAEGPEAVDTGGAGNVFRDALDAGVLYVPGAYCYAPRAGETPPANRIRLSYAHPGDREIRDGIRRLGRVLAAHG